MAAQKKTVLVVEDDEELRKLLVDAVERHDCICRQSGDGMQASNIVRETRFDGMILDIKLPSMSGLQVAAVARSSELNRSAAITVISGGLEKEHVARAAQIGISDMVLKPFDTDEIIDRLISKMATDNSHKSYDTRIINAFVAAANEVLTFYFGVKPKLGKPAIKKDERAPGYVTGLIGLSGKTVMGSMSITSSREFIFDLASKIFAGQPVEQNDQLVADLAGELCNQVVGKVKISLGKIGMKVLIGLPEVVIGKDHIVIHKARNPVIVLPISIGASATVLEFCFAPGVDEEIDEQKAEESAEGVILFE